MLSASDVGALRLTKAYVHSRIAGQLILWIDPRAISYDVGTKWPVTDTVQQRLQAAMPFATVAKRAVHYLRALDPFVIPARYYRKPQPLDTLDKYRLTKDLIEHRQELKSTLWYRYLAEAVGTRGAVRHKHIWMRDEAEIVEFFHAHVFDLIDSMAVEGYRVDKNPRFGTALVGADGTLHKSGSGNHRFYVARLLGISPFPVQVAGVHEVWYDSVRSAGDAGDLDSLALGLKEVERRHRHAGDPLDLPSGAK